MSYLVLARKWRPRNFDEVVGQVHVTRTLINAIEMDRVAHSFIFSGVRGVGKTSLARILAKALNCKNGPTPQPCGECDSCKSVATGTAVDVIEIDGASNNSVEDIRKLRETVPFRPVLGKFKIYVIDEVHMLSMSAFNALLKTLEEPPPHVKFIFATTESHKIPVTILSRCQRYDFRRIPTVAIVERLAKILDSEQIAHDDSALSLIGREAEGSMRDALSILDQVLAAGSDRITADFVAELLGIVERQVLYDVSRAVLQQDPRRCLEIVMKVDNRGYDISIFSKGLLEHLRNLVVAAHCKGDNTVLDLPDEEATELASQAKMVSADTLHRFFKHFSEAYESIARSSHPRILLETTLARIASLGELVPASELVSRLERLMKATGGVPPGSSSGSVAQETPAGGRQPSRSVPTSGARPSEAVDDAQAAVAVSPPSSAQPNRVTVESSSPTVSAGTINGAAWDEVVAAFKREKPAMASFLEYGSPSWEGTSLTMTFTQEYSSIAAMARDRAAEIERYISERLGKPIRMTVTVGSISVAPNAAKQRILAEDEIRRRRDDAVQHPLIRQIQSEFQADVSNIQLENGEGTD